MPGCEAGTRRDCGGSTTASNVACHCWYKYMVGTCTHRYIIYMLHTSNTKYTTYMDRYYPLSAHTIPRRGKNRNVARQVTSQIWGRMGGWMEYGALFGRTTHTPKGAGGRCALAPQSPLFVLCVSLLPWILALIGGRQSLTNSLTH